MLTNKIFFGLVLLALISPIVSADDYCPPPADFTTVLEQNGNWFNFTIYADTCYICIDNGAGYGDVDCTPCDNNPPVASFTGNVTCGIVPFVVNFTDTSTGVNITDWYWDFADGNTTEENPEHWYNITGVYGVDHSATNEYGTNWSNVSGYITARAVGDTCTGSSGYSYSGGGVGTDGDVMWLVFGMIGGCVMVFFLLILVAKGR